MNVFKKIREAEEAKPVTKMSLTRSLVTMAILLIVLSSSITAWITMAWFSNNKKVDGNGMNMDIESTANLVICDGETNIATIVAADQYFSVSYATNERTLKPATHVASGDAANLSAVDLKYVTNLGDVSATTGNARVDSNVSRTLTYAGVADASTYQDGNSPYYIRYNVRIASADLAMDASALKATLTAVAPSPLPTSDATHNYDYLHAASVDFYVSYNTTNTHTTAGLTGMTYVGTLDLTGSNYEISNLIAGLTLPNNKIPEKSDGYIYVSMIFYFDGALQMTNNGPAYVRSNYLTLNAANRLNMKVTFEAVEPAQSANP